MGRGYLAGQPCSFRGRPGGHPRRCNAPGAALCGAWAGGRSQRAGRGRPAAALRQTGAAPGRVPGSE
eukprot:8756410-Lingulodinium_polyedra.AAC.1